MVAVMDVGYKSAHDFVTEAWELIQDRHRRQILSARGAPDSEEQLRQFILAAFHASLHVDEGRAIRFRILFSKIPAASAVPLKEPLEYTSRNLVKLAPTTGLEFRLLVVRPHEGQLRIVGFFDRWLAGVTLPMSDSVRDLSPDEMRLFVLGPGHLQIAVADGTLELNRGVIRRGFEIGVVPSVDRWFRSAMNQLGCEGEGGLALIRHVWGEILGRVREEQHGGSLLIVPQPIGAAEQVVKIKYRIESPCLARLLTLIEQADGPLLAAMRSGVASYGRWMAEGQVFQKPILRQTTDFVASLATVDGAVVLTRDLTIVGFGAEICAPAVSHGTILTYESPGHAAKCTIQDLGMRHRSAAYFCDAVPGAIAFVVSQDGNVSVFHKGASFVERFVVTKVFPWIAYD